MGGDALNSDNFENPDDLMIHTPGFNVGSDHYSTTSYNDTDD